MFWKRKSPADALPLWGFGGDTLLTTHGVYLKGFSVFGVDAEHLDATIVTNVAKSLYNGAKDQLPDNTFLQFVLISSSNYADVFQRFTDVPEPADPVLAHQRRRRLDFMREGVLRRHALYLFVGERQALSRQEFEKFSQEMHDERVRRADRLARQVRGMLENTQQIWASPLSAGEMWKLLDEQLNPATGHVTPLASGIRRDAQDLPPPNPNPFSVSPRSELLRTPFNFDDPDVLKLGKQFCKVLTLKSLRGTSFPMMEKLFHLKCDFRLSFNVLVPNQGEELKKLNVKANIAEANTGKGVKKVQSSAASDHADAHVVLDKLLNDTNQKLIHLGMQVALLGKSKKAVEANAETFTAYLSDSNLLFSEEEASHEREFFNTLPGMAINFDRWRYGTSNNAVDLMPLFTAPGGDRRPIFLIKNHREELFSFDPRERQRLNWNVTVLGASGVGKSVLMNMIASTAMLPNAPEENTIIMDASGEENSSYRKLVGMTGGTAVTVLSRSTDVGLNPFPDPGDALDPQGNLTLETQSYLSVVLDILLNNNGESKDEALYRNITRRAVRELYAYHRDEAPILGDLMTVFAGYVGNAEIEQDRLETLRKLLGGVLDGSVARLLNRRTCIDTKAPVLLLDLFGIHSLEKNISGAVAYMVTEKVKRIAFADRRRTNVLMDETAQLMQEPRMAELVHALFSMARRYDTSVWTISQKFEEFLKSAVAGTVAQCSSSKFFLSHAGAENMVELVIKAFSLNGREAEILRSLVTRKGAGGRAEALLLTTVHDEKLNRERKLTAKVRIELSPFDYQLATSDPNDCNLQDAFIRKNPTVPVWQVLDHLAYHPQRVAAT